MVPVGSRRTQGECLHYQFFIDFEEIPCVFGNVRTDETPQRNLINIGETGAIIWDKLFKKI